MATFLVNSNKISVFAVNSSKRTWTCFNRIQIKTKNLTQKRKCTMTPITKWHHFSMAMSYEVVKSAAYFQRILIHLCETRVGVNSFLSRRNVTDKSNQQSFDYVMQYQCLQICRTIACHRSPTLSFLIILHYRTNF